jgi:HD-GYP domain-containing protein (c-di-GMP phosphodiesterase class II)
MREGKNNRMRVLAHLEENLHAKGGGRMGEHIRRMTDLGDRVAVALNLKETRRQDLHLLAQFHDLGLVNCPEAILSKPGPLSSEERGLVEEHPTTGYRIARSIPELTAIAELILAHHERWDGRGYPQGTRGSSIPETVRLFSVLNAFDAITHPRSYAPTLSSPEALKELRHCAGTQFDPQATDRIIPILDSWEGV